MMAAMSVASASAASAAAGLDGRGFACYQGLRRTSGATTLLKIAEPPSTAANGMRIVSEAVASPTRPPAVLPVKRSKVEIIKEGSNFLRFPLDQELQTEAASVNESAQQLIKFHGSYQQYDRDVRGGKAYSFMLRTKQPAGLVTNQLYQVMDSLADEFGIGTLRLTTRQTFQLHGVLKQNLKTVMSTIIKNMGSTLGACGDLNRNVLAPAAPYKRKDYMYAQEAADEIAALLAPQAGAYYDLWVDGEKIMTAEPPDVVKARNDNSHGTNFEGSPEPIYGTQFLPRKFKVAVTVPTDNSVDLLTNDVGIVTMVNDAGELQGYNIYVGGGMGRSHRIESTFPKLAEPLGYVGKDDLLYAVKAIVATQRDYGRRDDRRQARMKYLVHEWGIDKFRSVVETYYGKSFEPFQELPPWEFKSYLGWHEQGDGKLFLGVHVENGRVKGDAKKVLRETIEHYGLSVRLTPNQNLVLCDIRPSWQARIRKDLARVGLLMPHNIDSLNLNAMACPALPLCPLAIAEAERGAPAILKRIRTMFDQVGLKERDTIVVRFTGCPNGCARPYMAELGFVGDGANSYQIWLGGSSNQTRLAETFMEKVKVQNLEKVLLPLFSFWKQRRTPKESFGDFTVRMGFETLKSFIDSFEAPRARVLVDASIHARLQQQADKEGVSVHKLANQVLHDYIDKAPSQSKD